MGGAVGWGVTALGAIFVADFAPQFVSWTLILIIVGTGLIHASQIADFFNKVGSSKK